MAGFPVLHFRWEVSAYISGLCLSLGVLHISAPIAAAIQLTASTFDDNDEGWHVVGDAQSAVPSYLASGGNPGGFVRGFDSVVGGVWSWTAPSKFLGNKSAAYGFALTYDLRMRGSGPLFDDSDIILTGAALSLYLKLTPPVPQDVTWTSYSALIRDTAGWHTTSLTGPLATETQIKTVLSNLTGLSIRGEFISGSDNGDLDNVILNGALLGDYNNNGIVDAADYVLWRKHNNTATTLANDLTSGTDGSDYTVWRANFGLPPSAAGSSLSQKTLPEPATLVLLMIAGLASVSGNVRPHRKSRKLNTE